MKERPLTEAAGWDKFARYVAEMLTGESYCKRGVQMMMAGVAAQHHQFSRKMGMLNAPFTRAARFLSRRGGGSGPGLDLK